MIAKVCDRESRRDTWFENRLVSQPEGIGELEGKLHGKYYNLSGNRFGVVRLPS